MGKFQSTSVSYHFDTPKQVYQIHLNKPFKWLTSVKTESEAKQAVEVVKQLISLPNGAQMVKHLNVNLS